MIPTQEKLLNITSPSLSGHVRENINTEWYLETLLSFMTTEQSPNLSQSVTRKRTLTPLFRNQLYNLISNNLLTGAVSTQSLETAIHGGITSHIRQVSS